MKGKIVDYVRHVAAVVYYTQAGTGSNEEMAAAKAVREAIGSVGSAFNGARWVLEALTITPQHEQSNLVIAVGRRVKRGVE